MKSFKITTLVLVLYTNIDQTLVNSLHGLLNCEIGGLDCHVITAEHRTRVHCIQMLHLFWNALVHVIYSGVSGQCSHTISHGMILCYCVISGYTGFVPRARPRLGMGYPIITHEALNEFTNDTNRLQNLKSQSITIRRPEVSVLDSKLIYPLESGLVPHYTGHIPGMFACQICKIKPEFVRPNDPTRPFVSRSSSWTLLLLKMFFL